MTEPGRCTECGAELPEGARLGDLCPRCLVQLGLAAPGATETVPPGDSPDSSSIGPYTILETLGEGGMGIVYLAEQREPIRRRVALKIIKPGMDSRQVLARFESERQALAILDHPNVAKVHDAGQTESGRPYFVMEHVSGIPITEYCDRNRLANEDRLELFVQVCSAVQHAHQKGIIHRDLKPSNVLVALQDGRPVPKVIDFGVAKAIQQRLTKRSLFTEQGVLIGTPEYMSPEQTEVTALDIDTRTDVYSLGVMLYELLVGALPIDPKELRAAGYDEMRRRIREEEPSKPSARLSTLGDAGSESATHRRTDASSLIRQIRGDLDWITMKALEKDRTRRYDSPNELAADIRRHLTDEPVIAGPPSVVYRARKFARRHRLAVATAAVGVVLLAGIAVRERFQSIRIADERDRANLEAATAQQVSEFLVGLFQVSDPSEARGNNITAREILDKGVKEIEETLAEEPEVQARLMTTMGDVYIGLGLYRQAEPLMKRSLEIRLRILGDNNVDTLESINNLGVLHFWQSQYDLVEPYFREAMEGRRRVLGAEHPDTLGSINNMGSLLQVQGRLEEAEPYFRETLAVFRRVLGDDHPDTLSAINNMGHLLYDQGRLDEAETYFREGLKSRRRVQGDDHPDTLGMISWMGGLLQAQGKLDEAEALRREALETYRRVLGDDHPETLSSIASMGTLFEAQGRLEEAERYYLEALEGRRRALGDSHRHSLISMSRLGGLYTTLGRHDEAEKLLAAAVDAARRSNPGASVSGGAIRNYGRLLTSLGRYAEAEAVLLEAHDILNASFGPGNYRTVRATRAIVELYDALGKPEQAAEWSRLLPPEEEPLSED